MTKKSYVISFSITVIILFAVVLVLLMLLLPQQSITLSGSIEKYEQINSSDYRFEQTKDISTESLIKEYTISDTDLASFQKYNQYKPGKADPFTPQADLDNEVNNGNPGDTDDKTNNGNGGIPNPPGSKK